MEEQNRKAGQDRQQPDGLKSVLGSRLKSFENTLNDRPSAAGESRFSWGLIVLFAFAVWAVVNIIVFFFRFFA